jgi:leader peptidase (prepilin peptidase) / N-methyltransferase
VTTPVAVLLAAVVAGVLGLLVPSLVRALPEPPPPDEPYPGEPPKPPYAELAARPRLAVGSAATAAAAAALAALGLGADPWLVAVLPLVPVSVALAFIDLHTRLLPSRIVLPATAYALVVALVLWAVSGDHDDVLRGVIGLVVLRSVYWVLWRIHSAGMGFGDVRLAALVGLLLGHVGWSQLVVGSYAAFLVFGVPGVVLALVRWDRSLLRTPFPFGPAMLVGALVGLLAGPWVASYLAWG